LPKKYIYEPWEAPLEVQRKCGVIIGKDYPEPIVDHKSVSKSNMGRMKEAYDAHKANAAAQPAGTSSRKRARDSD
jgi:cryptochrome